MDFLVLQQDHNVGMEQLEYKIERWIVLEKSEVTITCKSLLEWFIALSYSC